MGTLVVVLAAIGVTGFFEPLQHDCLAHQRIADGPPVSGNDCPGSSLGVEHLLPKWDAVQPLQRCWI